MHLYQPTGEALVRLPGGHITGSQQHGSGIAMVVGCRRADPQCKPPVSISHVTVFRLGVEYGLAQAWHVQVCPTSRSRRVGAVAS